MAQAGVTTTGLEEMRTAVRSFPKAVQSRLRAVAESTAQRVLARAQENLRRQTHGTGATAAAIVVAEVPARLAFEVRAGEPEGRHPALPLFLEFGTRHMAARPFMGPALEAESEQYRRDLQRASEDVAREVFG